MRWPIRNQIMLPLVAVAVLSLTTVGAINAVVTERRTTAQVDQQLRHVVGVLTTSNFPLTPAVLRQMRDLSGAEFVLCDNAGRVVTASLSNPGILPKATPVNRIEDVSLGSSSLVADRWYFHTVLNLPMRSPADGSGVLHVLFPQDEYRRAWRQAFIPPLVVGAVTLLLVAIVANALASRMSRGITRLGEEVMRIARGEFRAVQPHKLDDEIRDLSLAVNRTAEILSDYEKQVRRSEQIQTLTILGASIAHQIRNAATGCRMALDLHAADCQATDHGESLDVARKQLRLMEGQIQRFLSAGKQPAELNAAAVDLGKLVEFVLPLVQPAAVHAGVALDCRIPSKEITVSADQEALGQVITNLLLNAVEAAQQNGIHRPGQSRVSVAVGASSDEAEVVISDSGQGPAEAVAESLFEPFVTDKAEGAGLGLAMAKQVVTAHGGSIGWQRDNGVTKFRIVLPRSRSECTSVENSYC